MCLGKLTWGSALWQSSGPLSAETSAGFPAAKPGPRGCKDQLVRQDLLERRVHPDHLAPKARPVLLGPLALRASPVPQGLWVRKDKKAIKAIRARFRADL